MKKRIISSIGLIPFAVAVVFSDITTVFIILILSLIAMYEYSYAMQSAGHKPIRVLGYVFCIFIVFISYQNYIFSQYFVAGVILFILTLLMYLIIKHPELNIADAAITLFGMLYIPFMFSFIILIRRLDGGSWYVWLPFIGAWSADTSAYFCGTYLGKRKLIPKVSPKKTVEGSIGGVAGAIIMVCLYGLLINSYYMQLQLYHYIMIGFITGIVSQAGDLAASSIKRYSSVKDFGSLIPGHGGILDRFDSIIPIAPFIYFYIFFIIL